MDKLLSDIEAFCEVHHLSDWRFGDLALRDRYFLRQLRAGREPRSKTVNKVRAFMADYQPAKQAA